MGSVSVSSCRCCMFVSCAHSKVNPVFTPVAAYGYLLFDMYLFMADITNPDLIV